MDTIEIRTTQNVVIEYELGKLGERIGAFFIDLVIIIGTYTILELIVWRVGDFARELTAYLIIVPVVSFYTLFFEIVMNGQTPGKRVMNLKAIRLDGREAGSGDYVIRWAFRLIDIWFSLGMVASLLISSSDKNQRIGDVLSDMVVVRLKPSRQFTLNDILKIRDKTNYNVQYPQVVSFNDEEMLLVKNLLNRKRTFRNKAHDDAVEELAVILAERMGIDKPRDSALFLKALLEDYIVLTR